MDDVTDIPVIDGFLMLYNYMMMSRCNLIQRVFRNQLKPAPGFSGSFAG